MSTLLAWAWLFTLPGLVLTAFGVPGDRRRAGWASIPGPFLLLLIALITLLAGAPVETVVIRDWLPFLPDGAFRTRVDSLSATMLAILGFVGALVYVYSLGYMADDPGRRRFFVYLDLFLATMALLVLAGNLAVLLIGWTGVGISSFLLISFWRDRPGTLGAGLQALAANAIGDGALLLAAVLVPRGCGELTTLGGPQCTPAGRPDAELLALLLFVAAAAKSAQGPLYFWLPSAMAGPTPISALIHAATMVAAGVYLLVRTHAVIEQAPTAGAWIAAISVATAIAASLASYFQANFKRAIAYSTVAQLGYMFAAIGVGAAFAAFFHLLTHAAFKALLFLAAGVVIHTAGGEELLARLGGMRKRVSFSYWGFLVGSLALIGLPFLTAGFFSKDAIIEAALDTQPLVGALLLGSVFLTGLYTGRLFFGVYHGPEPHSAPSTAHSALTHEPHETHDPASARPMDWSLVPLMVASVLFGYLAWPAPWLQDLLARFVGEAHALHPVSLTGILAFLLGAAGFGLSGWLALKRPRSVAAEGALAPAATSAGWVGGLAGLSYTAARGLAALQTGRLSQYAFASVLAIAAFLLLRLLAD